MQRFLQFASVVVRLRESSRSMVRNSVHSDPRILLSNCVTLSIGGTAMSWSATSQLTREWMERASSIASLVDVRLWSLRSSACPIPGDCRHRLLRPQGRRKCRCILCFAQRFQIGPGLRQLRVPSCSRLARSSARSPWLDLEFRRPDGRSRSSWRRRSKSVPGRHVPNRDAIHLVRDRSDAESPRDRSSILADLAWLPDTTA